LSTANNLEVRRQLNTIEALLSPMIAEYKVKDEHKVQKDGSRVSQMGKAITYRISIGYSLCQKKQFQIDGRGK
jgi:hypothetical protein